MDKASAYGAGDCRFEPYWGHLVSAKTCVQSLIVGRRRHAWSPLQPDCILTCSGFGCFSTGSSLSCRADGSAEGLPPEAEELSAHDELLLPESCTMAWVMCCRARFPFSFMVSSYQWLIGPWMGANSRQRPFVTPIIIKFGCPQIIFSNKNGPSQSGTLLVWASARRIHIEIRQRSSCFFSPNNLKIFVCHNDAGTPVSVFPKSSGNSERKAASSSSKSASSQVLFANGVPCAACCSFFAVSHGNPSGCSLDLIGLGPGIRL